MTDRETENHQQMERPDARKFERRRIPVRARILDVKGRSANDCTIRDMSVVGAQVKLTNAQPIPDTIYLVDLEHCVAYKAKVAWWRPYAAGLAFQESYPLLGDIPSHLYFLKQHLIDSKLEEVDTLAAQGTSLLDAVKGSGISGTTYARWRGEREPDNGLAQRLLSVEAELNVLRKLMADSKNNDG